MKMFSFWTNLFHVPASASGSESKIFLLLIIQRSCWSFSCRNGKVKHKITLVLRYYMKENSNYSKIKNNREILDGSLCWYTRPSCTRWKLIILHHKC